MFTEQVRILGKMPRLADMEISSPHYCLNWEIINTMPTDMWADFSNVFDGCCFE